MYYIKVLMKLRNDIMAKIEFLVIFFYNLKKNLSGHPPKKIDHCGLSSMAGWHCLIYAVLQQSARGRKCYVIVRGGLTAWNSMLL